MVKNPRPMQERLETQVWSLGCEVPLEEEMATHPSILAWEIPWTEEHGRLHSWGCRVRHSWRHPHHHTSIFQDKWQEEHSPLFNFLVLDYYLEKLMAWRYPEPFLFGTSSEKAYFFFPLSLSQTTTFATPRHVLGLRGPPALLLDSEVHLQVGAGQLQSGTPPPWTACTCRARLNRVSVPCKFGMQS